MSWFNKLKSLQEMIHLLRIGFVICMCFISKDVMGDSRRPIYNIAHMVNSIRDLEDYLSRGANAIEMDISFYRNGTIRNVYHGYPCDCYRICDEREKLDRYLNHIRDLVDPKSRTSQKQLTLLLFDLKLDDVSRSQKFTAGEEIAKHLITHLWNKDISEPRISVLVSIGHTSDSEVARGVKETFEKSNRGSFLNKLGQENAAKQKVDEIDLGASANVVVRLARRISNGFDVGLNDDLNSIRRMWAKLQITSNRWQGDGVTNCLRPLKEDTRLKQAIHHRDSGSYVDKVYDWTVDLTANMRHSLRLGVDAILTNFPERVHSVLQEPEFRNRYRLADPNDDPFSRINVEKPSKSTQKRPPLDAYVGSLREMTVAFMGYFWDFYRLRLQNPGTLFPLIHEIVQKSNSVRAQSKLALKRVTKNG